MLGYPPSPEAGTPSPRSRHPPGPEAGPPRSRGRYPPPPSTVHAGRYGQQVGSMNPTGMQSFYDLFLQGQRADMAPLDPLDPLLYEKLF